MTLRVAVLPGRRWGRPGSRLPIRLEVRGAAPGRARVTWTLRDVEAVVAEGLRRPVLDGGAPVLVDLRIPLPAAGRRGYGVAIEVVDAAGHRARATAVVEALEGWWEAPRHVAWTDFGDARDAASQVAGATAWHATVAQAYDWMYRHYRYSAPTEPFLDALGRRVSHDAVRALVREGHRAGIATLAYGSVYGAEPEYVERHLDERVFDADGQPLSLGGAFYINDLRPGRPWRERLLREYERACRRFGFDGIHMDTYGPPHEAWTADGEHVRFDALYPGLVADGAARVAATGRDRRVLFNCVEGFPIDAVGPAPTAAHYLELWPPDDRYADVVAWIERARRAGPGRAVVIAAYVPSLREAGPDTAARAAAVETAVLLTTVVHAAGAFHHVLAERDRVLVEGYYPEAVRLRATEAEELRAAWRFGARYVHLLSDPAAVAIDASDVDVRDAAGREVPVSTTPRAGAIWARAARTPSGDVLSLVDLRDQADDRWTAPRQATAFAEGLRLRWAAAGAGAVAMSPWSEAGEPSSLAGEPDRTLLLPAFRRWLLVRG